MPVAKPPPTRAGRAAKPQHGRKRPRSGAGAAGLVVSLSKLGQEVAHGPPCPDRLVPEVNLLWSSGGLCPSRVILPRTEQLARAGHGLAERLGTAFLLLLEIPFPLSLGLL